MPAAVGRAAERQGWADDVGDAVSDVYGCWLPIELSSLRHRFTETARAAGA